MTGTWKSCVACRKALNGSEARDVGVQRSRILHCVQLCYYTKFHIGVSSVSIITLKIGV